MCFHLLLHLQTEDNEKEINRLSTFPFPPCMNSINRRHNTEWVQSLPLHISILFQLISSPHPFILLWKGLTWSPGAVMRMITSQVYLFLSFVLHVTVFFCKQNETVRCLLTTSNKWTLSQCYMIWYDDSFGTRVQKTNKQKRWWVQFWFCFLCIVSLTYEALWCVQVSRVNLLCGIPVTP